MDRIEGIPEGYRLGEATYVDRTHVHPTSITFELIPIEQPKQLEVVIVVPIDRSSAGWNDLDTALDSMDGLSKDEAHRLRRMYPDRVSIREREKGKL